MLHFISETQFSHNPYFTFFVNFLQELEADRAKLMMDVNTNKRKMQELEDNLLYKLTSTKVLSGFLSYDHE